MAVQQDRDSWMRQRLAGEVASGRVKRTANVDAFLQNKPMPGNKPIGDVFGQLTRDLGKLDKQINRNLHASEADKSKKGPSLSAVKKAAKEGARFMRLNPRRASRKSVGRMACARFHSLTKRSAIGMCL